MFAKIKSQIKWKINMKEKLKMEISIEIILKRKSIFYYQDITLRTDICMYVRMYVRDMIKNLSLFSNFACRNRRNLVDNRDSVVDSVDFYIIALQPWFPTS